MATKKAPAKTADVKAAAPAEAVAAESSTATKKRTEFPQLGAFFC